MLASLAGSRSGNAASGFSITGMAYHGEWNSTDQIPQRAVDDGIIDRFGAIDATDGGHSSGTAARSTG